jgi:hypothetical protein
MPKNVGSCFDATGHYLLQEERSNATKSCVQRGS